MPFFGRTNREHYGSEFEADDSGGGAAVPDPHPNRRAPRRTWRTARSDESVARRELWRRRLGADAVRDAWRAQRCPVDLLPRPYPRERLRGPVVRRVQGRGYGGRV